MRRAIALIILLIFLIKAYSLTDTFSHTWYVITNQSVYQYYISGYLKVPTKTNQNLILSLECSGSRDIYVHINISFKSQNTTWQYFQKNYKISCSPAGTINNIKLPVYFIEKGTYVLNYNISNVYYYNGSYYILSTQIIKTYNLTSYFNKIFESVGAKPKVSYISDSLAFTITKTNLLSALGVYTSFFFLAMAILLIIMYLRSKDKKILILAIVVLALGIINSKLATIYMYPQYSQTAIYKNNNYIGSFNGPQGMITDGASYVLVSLKTAVINDTIKKTKLYEYETSDYAITYTLNLQNVSHDYNYVKQLVQNNAILLNFPIQIRTTIPISNNTKLLGCEVTMCNTSLGKCYGTILLQKTIIQHNIYTNGKYTYYGGNALDLWVQINGKNAKYTINPPWYSYLTLNFPITIQTLPNQVKLRVNCVFRTVKVLQPNVSTKQLPTVNLDQYIKQNLGEITNKDNKKLKNKQQQQSLFTNLIFFGSMILAIIFYYRKNK